jgi:hypothetical protein
MMETSADPGLFRLTGALLRVTALALTFALASSADARAAGEPASGEVSEDAEKGGATEADDVAADGADEGSVDEGVEEGASYAPEDEEGEEPGGARKPPSKKKAKAEKEVPEYHNQRGSVIAGGMVGISKDSTGTRYAGGLSLGYAFLTGIVPSVRGLVAKSGDQVSGELAATLTLSPPLSISFVPFLMGEVGRIFDPDGKAWMYAGGGGFYLGSPEDGSALQLGYLFRRITFDGRNYDASGPLIAISVAL